MLESLALIIPGYCFWLFCKYKKKGISAKGDWSLLLPLFAFGAMFYLPAHLIASYVPKHCLLEKISISGINPTVFFMSILLSCIFGFIVLKCEKIKSAVILALPQLDTPVTENISQLQKKSIGDLLLFTLNSGKVYLGVLWNLNNIDNDNGMVTILINASGRRSADALAVVWNAIYKELDDEEITKDVHSGYSPLVSIPISSISTISTYNPEKYPVKIS